MKTFVLIPGAACDPWYWHLVEAELHRRGHDTVAVDLPCEDDGAGLAEYRDAAVAAIGDRRDLVVVGHSFGGFTAPLVCDRVAVDHLVLLTAMVPAPGETPGDWWENTGHEQARREQDARDGRKPDDEVALWMHDVGPDLADGVRRHTRDQSATPGNAPWPLAAWPAVPTTFLLCRDDRFFPADFMRRVVVDRLGTAPDEMPGSHHVMLSRPVELADRLETYGRRAH